MNRRRIALMLTAALCCGAGTGSAAAAEQTAASGDMNRDGSCDLNDVRLLLQWLSGDTAAAPADWQAGDLDGNGRLNAADLTLLKRRLLTDTRRLLWSDEFDGDTLDAAKWSYELGNWKLDADGNYITNGWGNNEQEFYTDRNASVHDGILTLSARHETYTDAVQGSYDYTSARICTAQKYAVCGGRIEVRARCDAGKSLWPAIWMLPEDSAYGGWAASGEIDIMEGWGSTPQKICGTIHFGDVWPNNTYLTADYSFAAGDSAEGWHSYAVEWERGEIRWYVDDVCYSTQSEWYSANHASPAPFDQKFYIILNLAVGGHFDGVDGIYGDPSVFADGPRNFEIDYVRVYALPEQPEPTPVTSLPLEAYTEGASAVLTNRDGCTEIAVSDTGTLPYGVMGLIRGRQVAAGETHMLSFDVSCTAEREITVTAEDAAYTRYLDETVTVGPEQKHFSFPVQCAADLRLDLKFLLGSIGNAAAAGAHTVTIANISWE